MIRPTRCRFLSARPSEPPISPVPMMVTCLKAIEFVVSNLKFVIVIFNYKLQIANYKFVYAISRPTAGAIMRS